MARTTTPGPVMDPVLDPVMDPVDLDVVAALQVAPRASTRALAQAVGTSASTVARRIARMVDERLLRVVGQLPWDLVAQGRPHHVWLSARPSRSTAVAERLARLPEAPFVALTTGSADVFCTLYPRRRSQTRELLTSRVGGVDGVVSMRSELVLRHHLRADQWRMTRLSPEQVTQLSEHRVPPPPDEGRPTRLSAVERRIATLLAGDARADVAELARAAGVSASTAHRAVTSLLERGVVRPRVEVEPVLLGYQLEVVVAVRGAPGAAPAVAQQLAEHPSARFVSLVAGTSSVIHQGVFVDEDALADFLSTDVARLDGVVQVEVSVVLDVLRRYWTTRDGGRLGVTQIPLL